MMKTPEFRVHVTNPRKRKGRKSVPKKRTKKSTKKRARRRNPSNPPKRTRRRNPMFGGANGISFRGALSGEFARQLGKAWVSFAVQKWGESGSLLGDAIRNSRFKGRSWPLRNYLIGIAAAYLGAKVLSRIGWGRAYAKDFWIGGFTAIMSKLIWTEGFARSPMLQSAFGQPNNWYQDEAGTSWVNRDGSWQSMMGQQLVSASALDGQLVSESSLDGGNFGQLVSQSTLDGRFRGMGHYLPESSSDSETRAALYRGDGSKSPYHSAFSSAFSSAYGGI